MKEWLVKLKARWQQLAEREQRVVAGGGLVLVVIILYVGIWQPFLNYNDSLRVRIASEEKNLQWMRAVDKKMQQMSGKNKTKPAAISPIMLLGVLQKDIQQAGMSQQLAQLKQINANSIAMSFQKIAFDQLMTLLINIAKAQSIAITKMSVTASNAPGMVNADVVLSLA